jgi:excisionase family DNA binding protein
MPDSDLLTVAQVADELQVTAQTIRNWIERGVIPALRIGRAYRIRREDVDLLLDRAQAESASLAASRDTWEPGVWRLPRRAEAGESVWEEERSVRLQPGS